MFWRIAFSTLGGLGLFLFGIQMMASGMQKATGDRFRRILEVMTNRPVMGVITGFLVTLLIQSSSTTSVMVVGFANAGLMNLSQAISTIIGANVGTTITAQIVSLNISVVALPAIGIGSIINFLSRRRTQRYLGQAVLGFGLLFLGITTMSAGLSPLKALPAFHNLLSQFSANPLLGVMVGALFSALIQSSNAATAVIIALAMQDLITFQSAVPLVLGINIGTCITAILACIGANVTARRTAAANVLFNLIGAVLVLLFLGPFSNLVVLVSADSTARQVANAHTIFNVINAVIFVIFFRYFTRFVCYIIPGPEDAVDIAPKYLDKRMLKTPAAAIGGVKQELLLMAGLAREVVAEATAVFLKNDLKKVKHLEQMEDLIDDLEREINEYLAELSQHSLTQHQSRIVGAFMSVANDLERIGDHAQNILQLAESKVEERLPFSNAALEELNAIYQETDAMMECAITAFNTENKELAHQVIKKDDEIDKLERMLRQRHIERINQKSCYPASGVIYLDVLSNMERIADHATNMAQAVVDDF